jgi:hypothetical protein
MKNHLGTFECKLCLTLHPNEGNYLAHTQGKRHQDNLARRAARERKEGPGGITVGSYVYCVIIDWMSSNSSCFLELPLPNRSCRIESHPKSVSPKRISPNTRTLKRAS